MALLENNEKWLDSISPTLRYKLELLELGEDWVLNDDEFKVMLEQLALRISQEEHFLQSLFDDDRIISLIVVLAHVRFGVALRIFGLADPTMMFESTVVQWCVDHVDDTGHAPVCNVLVSRFDWIIQQDLNSRIFGKFTRQRVKKLLNSIPR